MREFFIIKKDGTGMIVNAIDEEDALCQVGSGVVSIEESFDSIKRRTEYNDTQKETKKNNALLKYKIERLIKAVNNTKYVSVWERHFCYGIKKQLLNGNSLTERQREKLEEIYSKILY